MFDPGEREVGALSALVSSLGLGSAKGEFRGIRMG